MRLFRWIVAALCVAAFPIGAFAQQTEGRITGTVQDQSQGSLPGVSVVVESRDTGASRTAVTDAEGRFVVTNLGPGRYVVKAELSGFQTRERDVVLGVGQIESLTLELGIAAVSEEVVVQASAPVLDVASARIGVNVSPEEVQNLPVNGRNFANLMTLAPGATSDGNGGWASVRFNGKSNQQNYLNYDGVDGTYVWDASPRYLSATGSQFRLQTSMESVAEFRVNSGLAPAESGLGAGGNITVVTKSGSNQFRGSGFWYLRNDALDSASKYDDTKQPLELNQYGGSFGGPIVSNRTFFFASFEGLRQTTGLTFTEAVPSDEARRRILAGEPVGSGGGQSPARTMAVAPLLERLPAWHRGDLEPARCAGHEHVRGGAAGRHRCRSASITVLNTGNSFYVRYLYSNGQVDTPDRTATPRRILANQEPQNLVANWQSIVGNSIVNEIKVGYNWPHTSADAFGPAGYDPLGVSLSGTFTSSSIDARGNTGIARSGLIMRATSAATTTGLAFDPSSLAFSDALTWTRGGAHIQVRAASIARCPATSSSSARRN